MANWKKRHILNFSFILLLTLLTSVYFSISSSYDVNLIARILYGLSIGTTIALGCGFISRFFFKLNGSDKDPIKNFTVLVISIATFIFLDILFVNIFWIEVLLQGTSFMNYLSPTTIRATILVEFTIGLTAYLIILAKNFSTNMKKYYEEIGEIKNELSKYKYETLKNQLNPHFLFNMLNTLSGLIHKDVDKSDTFIHHFSLLYRYVLKVEPEDVVQLPQELDFIAHFLFLNNIRFNDAIISKINIQDKSQYIVPMALQLAFENAIKHNQFNKEKPLIIEVVDHNGYLKITNSKSKKENAAPSNHLGIPILQTRYAKLSNKAVKIEEDKDTFTLFLPILKATNK